MLNAIILRSGNSWHNFAFEADAVRQPLFPVVFVPRAVQHAIMFLKAGNPLMVPRLLLLVCLLAGNAHARWIDKHSWLRKHAPAP